MKDYCSACGRQHTSYCSQEQKSEHEPTIPPVSGIGIKQKQTKKKEEKKNNTTAKHVFVFTNAHP